MAIERVISGMRPTGNLHLGHYNGVLKNWINLQHEFECLFFVADWHALTTHYDSPEIIEENVWEMVVDWLAAGVDPATATIFIQSKVPEHAELHTLLSMITPLGWRKFIKFTGTGLAHPNKTPPNNTVNAGRIMVPMGSICLRGLRLILF